MQEPKLLLGITHSVGHRFSNTLRELPRKGNKSNGNEFNYVNYHLIDSIEVSGYLWGGVKDTEDSDISFTHVYIHDNSFNGILVSPENYNSFPAKPIRNIYIAHCVALNNPGCPAVTGNKVETVFSSRGVTNGISEYCRAMYNGWDMPRGGNGSVENWAAKCDNIIIQHCWAHNNITSPEGHDGGGFDFDRRVTHSIMHYNLHAENHATRMKPLATTLP